MKKPLVRPVPHLGEVERYLPGRTIEEIQRLYGLKEVIKLASNEGSLGPSPRVIERIVKELPEIHRYPEGEGTELKLALARRFRLDPEAILLGNGSNEVLELCLRAFVLPGETVISAQITFGMYKIMSKVYGARYLEVPMVEMRYDLEEIARLARKEKARLIFIANPNNPTGLAFSRDELRQFLKEIPPEIAVVYDAAYSEYAEEEGIPSGEEFLDHPNFIMVRTFSKAYGLAGLRVGWAVMAPELCAMAERVRQPFNVNRLAMVSALTALEDTEHLRRVVELNRQGRQFLSESLREAGLKVLMPSYANFVTFETPIPADEFCELILRQGVIIRSLRSFGLPHHARVNTGTFEEMERFRIALLEVLRCLKL